MAEARVEEARVMHPEFADHCKIRRHFCGAIRRDRHGFAADEDIEGAGVEDDAPFGGMDRLPEFGRVIMADAVEVDDTGMRLGAVADEVAGGGPEVDREAEAVVDDGLDVDELFGFVPGAQIGVREYRLTLPEPDLVQAHAGAHEHREGAGADLGIERAGVARRDAVEFDSAVRDRAGEQIEAAG